MRKIITKIVPWIVILVIGIYIYYFYPFSTYLFIHGIEQKYIAGQQNINDDIIIKLSEQQYNRKHDITVLPILCSYLMTNEDYEKAAKYLDIASKYDFENQNKSISISRVEVYIKMNNYDNFVKVYNEEKTKLDYNRKQFIDGWIYILFRNDSLSIPEESKRMYCAFMVDNIDENDKNYNEAYEYYNSYLN